MQIGNKKEQPNYQTKEITKPNTTTMANEVIAANPNSISRIAVGTSIIKGEIVSEHDIRFDGNFDGCIYSKGRIIVGEAAKLSGDVLCDNFDVWGNFEGTINVKDTITLKSGCAVKGVVNSGKLVVELGSKLDAQFSTLEEAAYTKLLNDCPYFKNEPKPAEPKPFVAK